MNFGETNLVKLVRPMLPPSKCNNEAPIELAPKGPAGQGGASGPPPRSTGSGFGPTWPPRSVDTLGDTYIDEFPL
jgi:hypothetical protein